MSSRYVWPYDFSLSVSGLVEALRQQKVPPVRDKFFPTSTGNPLPIALRWSHAKELGFPREPFQVFRRLRDPGSENAVFVQVLAQSVPIPSQPVVSTFAAGDAAYVVSAAVSVPTGSAVTMQALDIRSRPIPGQTATIALNSIVQFRCPGIVALQAFGSGTIGPLSVIPQTVYANLPDWQKIQAVGLPLLKDESGVAYNTFPQGIEPAGLDGATFATDRMLITALLQVDPFGTGIGDFPLPAWPVPDAVAYVANIRSAKSLVPMIERCLKNSKDTDPAKQQSAYVETVTVPGVKQSNVPGATANPAQTTQATLPIVGISMLAASTDSYAAVSLGYGTIDIPPQPQVVPPAMAAPSIVHPAVDSAHAYDYMVTAPFTVPFLSITLAALSAGQAPVEAPASLQTVVKQTYPPIQRNQPAPASIQVSWSPPDIPQGYGILASRAPNTSEVLNGPRPPAVNGFDPFIGLIPNATDPATPPDQQTPSFSHATGTLPLDAPPSTTRYLVAGLDVFGLWSVWMPANATLSPLAITKPGIRNVEFHMDPTDATGHVVPAKMRIEFAWDWQDRAPGQIRFTGQFVPAGSSLGPTPFLTGFTMSNTAPADAPVVLTFTYANQSEADTIPPAAKVPTIDPAHSTDGPVLVLPSTATNPDNQQVLYRFDLNDFSLDFTATDELDFALYVTATEQIRSSEFSDATDPVMKFIGKIVRARDPLPPAVNFSPPSISWTALPDATGTARGLLQWTPDPKAAGYYVWEATESALWRLLSPQTPDPPADTPLVTRGASLKALIDNNPDASLQGFARLNKDPISAARTEIKVPATAATLYAYRISAISATNVETPRSLQVAIVGVPRRNVPGAPRMLLRKLQKPQTGIQVIALPVDSGATPTGYRVFRVQNQSMSLDASTMGPPKIDETNPAWQDFSGTTLAGNPLTGQSIIDTAPAPSWYPYYYRITAIGANDLANGLLSGESGYSGAQSQYSLPPNLPLLAVLVLSGTPQFALITLLTDLPITPSPLGPALVEVLHIIHDTANPGHLLTQGVLSSAPNQIPIGVIALPPIVPPVHRPSPPVHPPLPVLEPIHPPEEPVQPPAVQQPVPPSVVYPPAPLVLQVLQPVPPPVIPPIPLPPPLPQPTTRMARSAPDANGRWTLYILLPYTAAQKNTFSVRLTDPLARQSSHSF
jgi:hypothetical protein